MAQAIYTFLDLQEQVLAWLDESDNVDTTQTLVRDAINQAQQLRLKDTRWPFTLWPTNENLAVTTATRFYTLHPMADKVESLYNPTTRKYVVEVPVRGLPGLALPPTSTQIAGYFRLIGVSPVTEQPTSATTVRIVSSNVLDTGATKTVIVKGVVSGAYIEETLVSNGTTQVTSTNSFDKILAITKVGTWVGTMTFSTSGGTTLLVLTAGEYARQYPLIEFLHLPSNDTLQYRFHRQPIKLVEDHDIPDIPAPYSQVLVWDALLQMAAYNTDADAKAVAIWRDNQTKWENAMAQAYLEGQSLEAVPRRVKYTDEDISAIQIFPSP